MDIGYACICIGDHNKLRSLKLASVTKEKLHEIYLHNLKTLESNLKYNAKNGIRMFRVSSDIFPLITHEDIFFDWKGEYKAELDSIKKLVSDNAIKLSMHPGQYTVLNSKNSLVADKAIIEIDHHSEFLSHITPDISAPVIVHVSSASGDRSSASELFLKYFKRLSNDSKNRLCIENDERASSASDIYSLACLIKIPAVFDNLHNMLNPSYDMSDKEIIKLFSNTFLTRPQKIHYSQQNPLKKSGAHSITIDHREFIDYVNMELSDMKPDIMLEVKDKDLSCIKCMDILNESSSTRYTQWARYKYFVMERSYGIYKKISQMFNEGTYYTQRFYDMINEAVYEEPEKGAAQNTAMHVWGYFKKIASTEEKTKYISLMEKFSDNKTSNRAVKKFLLSLALKYEIEYLKDSIYFVSDIYG